MCVNVGYFVDIVNIKEGETKRQRERGRVLE